MPTFRLRCGEGELELWRAAAGGNVSAWARGVLNEAARVPTAGVSDRVVARHAGLVEGVSERVAAARRVPRSVMCEHRVPVGSFCKLCDS